MHNKNLLFPSSFVRQKISTVLFLFFSFSGIKENFFYIHSFSSMNIPTSNMHLIVVECLMMTLQHHDSTEIFFFMPQHTKFSRVQATRAASWEIFVDFMTRKNCGFGYIFIQILNEGKKEPTDDEREALEMIT